jgi:hypothetical protein
MNDLSAKMIGSVAFLANAIGSGATGIESWIPAFVQSGAIGLLAFVLWHVFTKIIPRLIDALMEAIKHFREETAAMRADFKEALKEAIQEAKK